MDVEVLLFLVEEVGDLEVLGVAALEEDLVVVAQVEAQEGVQVEGQGGDLEEVREAGDEAADP